MRFPLLAPALLAAQAIAFAVPQSQQLSETELLRTLLENPNLLAPSTRTLLTEKLKHVSKRDPQFSMGNLVMTIGTLQALITSLRAPDPKAPKATVSEVEQQQTKAWAGWGDVQKAKIRYGPYRIPPTSEKNLESELLNERGMGNTLKLNATRPCTGDCTILSLSASMEYADGKPAENANGAWFHHALLLNSGQGAKAGACSSPVPVENMFMVGNEKSEVFFGLEGSSIKSGYRLQPQDSLILDTQLMNMQDQEKWVWVTITYEYLNGPQPGFKSGRNVWKSISTSTAGYCPISGANPFGPSNVTVEFQPKSDVFMEHSVPWQSPFDGYILMTGGHMHDGGTNTEIFQNDKLICTSVPKYGKTAAGEGGEHGGMSSADGGSKHNMDIEHIIEQSRCKFNEGIPIKKGDKMYIRVNYDFKTHPGMKNKKEEWDSVMGIVGSLVAFQT